MNSKGDFIMSYMKNYDSEITKIGPATEDMIKKIDGIMDKAFAMASAQDVMQMDPESFAMLREMLSLFEDTKTFIRKYAEWADMVALTVVMNNHQLDDQNRKLDEILNLLRTSEGA